MAAVSVKRSIDGCYIKDAAFVSTSRLLFLSVNKYQYRRNLEDILQDILRNVIATLFLQKYISKFKFRLPTLSMTCNLWPPEETCREINDILKILREKMNNKADKAWLIYRAGEMI